MLNKDSVRLCLLVLNARGAVKLSSVGTGTVSIESPVYEDGDRIVLESDKWPIAVHLQLDSLVGAADIWLTSDKLEFLVPFGEKRDAYPPESFQAGSILTASLIDEAQWRSYRNISENPLDKQGDTSYYPHCTANVETRDESVFAARNTIDGVVFPECHGAWPYQSWGDNEDPRAEIMIAFGRTVRVDRAVIHLRADFPHDSYWRQATLLFSDGSREQLTLEKTGEAQNFSFSQRCITWVKLTELVKQDDDSPFPALTQWAIFGTEQNTEY